jgi:hypothetical protein
LTVDGSTLLGVPASLAGTSGGAGGKLGVAPAASNFATGSVRALGGTGADSGAGLILIGRGLAFGASGEIDLSGDSSASTSTGTGSSGISFAFPVYPGPGGAGCPGGLLVLLDGSGVSVPDLGGKFTATCGSVPIDGTPLPQRGPAGFGEMKNAGWTAPGSGYRDESVISGIDMSNVAYRIQYIPGEETAQEDQSNLPVTPTDLFATPGIGKVVLSTTQDILVSNSGDMYEYYASDDNDRANAERVASGIFDTYNFPLDSAQTNYFWVRIRRPLPGVDAFSGFYPSSPTGGVSGTPLAAGTTDIDFNAVTDTYSATDAGPIDIVLTGPATQITSQQVKYATITTDGTYDFEISASFRLGVTGAAGAFTVVAAPAVWISTTLDAAVQGVDKDTNVYEPTGITGLISRPANTYRVGVLCSIFGDGTNFTATFRDISLRVTVVKR